MAWDKCFYMIEALMSFGVGSDFLSSGILPADRKTAAFTRAKNIFMGGILLAGGIYFYFKTFACFHKCNCRPLHYSQSHLLEK